MTDPQLDWLKKLVLGRGKRYWTAGAGQGWLTREDGDERLKLVLTMAPERGFYLQHKTIGNVSFDSIGAGNFEASVTVYGGGDPWALPTAFFISKEQAWAAVEEFCKTGQRSDKVKWMKHSEVKWNYGEPDG